MQPFDKFLSVNEHIFDIPKFTYNQNGALDIDILILWSDRSIGALT